MRPVAAASEIFRSLDPVLHVPAQTQNRNFTGNTSNDIHSPGKWNGQ